MPDFDPAAIQVLAFDIFGTTVDWRTGVAEQVAQIAADQGVTLDGGAFAMPGGTATSPRCSG